MANRKTSAIKYIDGRPAETFEALAGEEALQIRINGKAYTITMRTPGQEKFLAVGLLFTERVIRHPEDVINITEIPAAKTDYALIVDVQVREEALVGQNLFNRSIASSASCGVCGKIDLCDLVMPEGPLVNSLKLDIERIPGLLRQMQAGQSAFERTGGSHAAAIFSIDGALLSVQEDIGRHNAVDKVIGELFLSDGLGKAAIMVVSGRVSYEIVSKCAVASVPFLLAVSAPSSLAVDLCWQHGITLIGFCRENRATVYTHGGNILHHAPARETVSIKDSEL
jgi:FdhD protein